MAAAPLSTSSLPCSFCGQTKSPRVAPSTSSGPTPCICRACVVLCFHIYADDEPARPGGSCPLTVAQIEALLVAESANITAKIEKRTAASIHSYLAHERPAQGKSNLSCSFCGRAHAAVKKLIAGPKHYVCDGCATAAAVVFSSTT